MHEPTGPKQSRKFVGTGRAAENEATTKR